ncbi:hypothetical protein [Nocardioides sp. SYSU D00038]|uniref:hypothetical protein n=1 Tax=Nocardioides sp. SYSU D00038 TaxID=2812554 RepID=UPI001968990F|nr:hypothetical protein [Nocardioides sp. SYSU D00038]
MTKHLFRGNPRILVSAAPFVVAVLVLKVIIEQAEWHVLGLSPLLAAAISAEVFIVGFLLTGTSSDFKEAERLPGELAASLETMADECLIAHQEHQLPAARAALAQLVEIGTSVRTWLQHDKGFEDVLGDIRAFNGFLIALGVKVQATYLNRLRAEQHNIRKVVVRMDTMRRTSFVTAGYLIAEVTAAALLIVLLLTDIGPSLAPTLVATGLISYLLIYLVSLIRDLDNPFEYTRGPAGAADDNLVGLARAAARLRDELSRLEVVTHEPAAAAHPVSPDPVPAGASSEPPV